MSDLPIFAVVLVLVVALVLYNSIIIAAENERIALFLLGRFEAFRGPGLVFKTNLHKVVRLSVGDLGVVTSAEYISFDGISIPVVMASSFRIGDAVRIDSFGDAGPIVSRSSTRPEHVCPKCGHKF